MWEMIAHFWADKPAIQNSVAYFALCGTHFQHNQALALVDGRELTFFDLFFSAFVCLVYTTAQLWPNPRAMVVCDFWHALTSENFAILLGISSWLSSWFIARAQGIQETVMWE